jgi:hypothetical protein
MRSILSHLIQYIEQKPTAVLDEIKLDLCEHFEGLSISTSTLHRHLVNICSITLKKLEKMPAARVSQKVVDLRYQKFMEWESLSDFDYKKNCVFIDEAGFNLHITRNFGRSLKGTPAKAIVPSDRGISLTIFETISEAGIIDISMKKPEPVSAEKKRKMGSLEAK